jgi:glutathione S-transferase
MLKLCGFAASNYYNKVKLALLEKAIPFDEDTVFPGAGEELWTASPMGKIPFLKTAHGTLSESQCILEYLEDSWPEPPLYPCDAWGRARCRQLIQVLELYLEWPARRLYPAAYLGGSVTDDTRREVQLALLRGVKALSRLTDFRAYAFAGCFSYADCAALMHLPVVNGACKAVYGEKLFDLLPGVEAYLQRLADRPHVQRVNADRKAGVEAFAAHRASRSGAQGVARRSTL